MRFRKSRSLSVDLLFPEEEGYTLDERPLRLSLGTKKGTKSKRAQFVLVDKTQRRLALVLRALKRLTPPGLLLFPISYSSYRLLIKAGEEALGLAAGFTPHSPRAGFASDSRAEGWSFEEIREELSFFFPTNQKKVLRQAPWRTDILILQQQNNK